MSGAGEWVGQAAEQARSRRAAAAARRRATEGLEWGRPRVKLRWWEKVGMVFDLLDVFSLFK